MSRAYPADGFLRPLLLLVLLAPVVSGWSSTAEAEETAPQHPTDFPGLAFFVESTNGLSVATCSSLDCFDAGENAPLARQYCDTEVFPDGCLRRWRDQSAFRPTNGFEPPEWTSGRDFGQDDHDKPGVVLDCLNGKPCVRGGRGVVQELSLETEPKHEVGPVHGPFSAYLLARPIRQGSDFVYFGFAGTELTHLSDIDALKLRIDFRRPTTITAPGSVQLGQWHLIEIHRDDENRIRVYVNGWDHTVDNPVLPGKMFFRFLLSVSRGRAMHGDVAAMLIYDSPSSAERRRGVRDYFSRAFGLALGDGSPQPKDQTVELERGLLLHWPLDGSDCGRSPGAGPAARAVPRCGGSGPRPVSGRLGKALRFTDKSHGLRSQESHPKLDQLFRFTAGAWVRPSRISADSEAWQSIIDKRDSLEDGWDLYLTPDGRPFLRIDEFVLRGDRRIQPDQWTHLAGMYDGDSLRIYVDGRLDSRKRIGKKVSLGTSGPLWVGRKFDDGSSPFFGDLDEIRIYGRALSAPEVQALADP